MQDFSYEVHTETKKSKKYIITVFLDILRSKLNKIR